MFAIVLFALLVTPSAAQFIKQCGCSEIEGCLHKADDGFLQCANECQNHITELGGSYEKIRQCILDENSQIQSTIKCETNNLAGSCTKTGYGTVLKHYSETLKIAAFAEIESILRKSGIQAEAKSLFSLGKKFGHCVVHCLENGHHGTCVKNLGCGLALPPDHILVEQTKQCAIRSGFNTPAVRKICTCIAGAGISALAPLCNRIVID